MNIFEKVKGIPIDFWAEALGMVVSSSAVSPCPFCGAFVRSSNDSRPPLGFRPDGKGFRCLDCRESGDQLDFLSLFLEGKRWFELSKPKRAKVASWVDSHKKNRAKEAFEKPSIQELQAYPPLEEVQALWASSLPVEKADFEAGGYLFRRRAFSFDLEPVLRVIPKGAFVPKWAFGEKQAWSKEHRLLIPLFDSEGVMRSFKARKIEGKEPTETRKSLSPFGFAYSGLVMACNRSQELLKTGNKPFACSLGIPLKVLIKEGEIDFLGALRSREEEELILGTGAGLWSDSLAKRLALESEDIVRLELDDDEAGRAYAQKIRESLLRNTNINPENIKETFI